MHNSYKSLNKKWFIVLLGIISVVVVSCLIGMMACQLMHKPDKHKLERKDLGVTATTDKTKFKQGEVIKISVRNNLKESIFSHIGSGTPIFCIKYAERKTVEGNWEKLFAQCQYPHCINDIDAPQKIKSGQSETFEWKPLIFIDGTSEAVRAGHGQYKLLILYQDLKRTAWKTIYTNEFRIE